MCRSTTPLKDYQAIYSICEIFVPGFSPKKERMWVSALFSAPVHHQSEISMCLREIVKGQVHTCIQIGMLPDSFQNVYDPSRGNNTSYIIMRKHEKIYETMYFI